MSREKLQLLVAKWIRAVCNKKKMFSIDLLLYFLPSSVFLYSHLLAINQHRQSQCNASSRISTNVYYIICLSWLIRVHHTKKQKQTVLKQEKLHGKIDIDAMNQQHLNRIVQQVYWYYIVFSSFEYSKATEKIFTIIEWFSVGFPIISFILLFYLRKWDFRIFKRSILRIEKKKNMHMNKQTKTTKSYAHVLW